MKKDFKYYKYWYKVHKGMREHYESMFNTTINELRFTRLQKDHLESILEEVQVLINKWVRKEQINAVIKNGKERADIDTLIHFDLECGGIKDFNK